MSLVNVVKFGQCGTAASVHWRERSRPDLPLTRPSRPLLAPDHPVAMPLTRERIEHIREECFADDLIYDFEEVRQCTESVVRSRFLSGVASSKASEDYEAEVTPDLVSLRPDEGVTDGFKLSNAFVQPKSPAAKPKSPARRSLAPELTPPQQQQLEGSTGLRIDGRSESFFTFSEATVVIPPSIMVGLRYNLRPLAPLAAPCPPPESFFSQNAYLA